MLLTPSGPDSNIYSEVAKRNKEKELFEKEENDIVQRLAVLKKFNAIPDYEIIHLPDDHPEFYKELTELFPDYNNFISEKRRIQTLIDKYDERLVQVRVYRKSATWCWREVKILAR